MQPFEVVRVEIEYRPGHPSLARVTLTGGIQLDRLQIWQAHHGPLVHFPLGTGSTSLLELTPLLRSTVIRETVAAWRRDRMQVAA